MTRGPRKHNRSVGSVLEEAEQNLLSAFKKSSKTQHKGLKGDARANRIADFLRNRLPSGYEVLCKAEVVDYLDQRSGEVDILVLDKVRNAILSDDPLWIPAEALLAVIEVKSVLTKDHLRNAYIAAKKIDTLRPFKKFFTLAGSNLKKVSTNAKPLEQEEAPESLRCFRSLFAYKTNLANKDWLNQEWKRVLDVTSELQCGPESLDRILVLDKGLINAPSQIGTDESTVASVFQQWFIHLTNFLVRENGRRPAVDLQLYSKQKLPGWKKLSG
jgi:Domain of unknown function (DUF6602)